MIIKKTKSKFCLIRCRRIYQDYNKIFWKIDWKFTSNI